MTLDEFKSLCQQDECPAGINRLLEALWYDARGDWDAAHQIVQNISGIDSSWIHAYLHRKEGDLANASYWYRQAGRRKPDNPLRTEWERIVSTLLPKEDRKKHQGTGTAV